jgi:hypothetical protein
VTLFADFNSSVSVPFQRMRALLLEAGGGLQEGVAGAQAAAGDLKAAQRGAGANLSADVAVGAAWIAIDTGTRNGIGHVFSDATFNAGPFTAGNGTNPRIDQVILRWNDTSIPTGAGNVPTIEVLTGTATAGATLDNRLGATALPNDCVRLADVLMPVSAVSVTTANIRDRRPWARGAYRRIVRNSNAAAGSDYTTASATTALVDATNLQPRIECSGLPLRATLRTNMKHSAASAQVNVGLWLDGAAVDGGLQISYTQPAAGTPTPLALMWDISPAPGSHLVGPAFQTPSGATASLLAQATIPLQFTVEEIVRQNADNT